MGYCGAYFTNPDCMEAIPHARTRDELIKAAQSLGGFGILVITSAEFSEIVKEVGLAYRWQGHRLAVR